MNTPHHFKGAFIWRLSPSAKPPLAAVQPSAPWIFMALHGEEIMRFFVSECGGPEGLALRIPTGGCETHAALDHADVAERLGKVAKERTG